MIAAKAWVALVGSIVTALLGLDVIPVVGPWHVALTVISATCTSILTWAIPNKPDPELTRL